MDMNLIIQGGIGNMLIATTKAFRNIPNVAPSMLKKAIITA